MQCHAPTTMHLLTIEYEIFRKKLMFSLLFVGVEPSHQGKEATMMPHQITKKTALTQEWDIGGQCHQTRGPTGQNL